MKEKFFINDKGCIVFPESEERLKARETLVHSEVSFAEFVFSKIRSTNKPEYYSELAQKAIKNIQSYEV